MRHPNGYAFKYQKKNYIQKFYQLIIKRNLLLNFFYDHFF